MIRYAGESDFKTLHQYDRHICEAELLKDGHKMVLTSTQSDEQGQFFYRKLGYRDCGALLLPDEPLEILMLKQLRNVNKGI